MPIQFSDIIHQPTLSHVRRGVFLPGAMMKTQEKTTTFLVNYICSFVGEEPKMIRQWYSSGDSLYAIPRRSMATWTRWIDFPLGCWGIPCPRTFIDTGLDDRHMNYRQLSAPPQIEPTLRQMLASS